MHRETLPTGTATTTGGALVPIIKPGVALTIFCSCDRAESRFFDAVFLAQRLSEKYQLDSVRTRPVISRGQTEGMSNKAAIAEAQPVRAAASSTTAEGSRRDIAALGESPRYPFVERLSNPMLTLLNSGRAKTIQHAYLLACETDAECAKFHSLR